jgi:hypothetical protein
MNPRHDMRNCYAEPSVLKYRRSPGRITALLLQILYSYIVICITLLLGTPHSYGVQSDMIPTARGVHRISYIITYGTDRVTYLRAVHTASNT